MQKDILARLLATENITVVHENAQTASFNVKDRVLTLPLWDDLTGDNYDHFIGHEVGHALYTPEEGWHDAVCDKGRGYKSFLNVIEDARIERMIQIKYPGLRRNFINSYKKLLADGLFGADLDEINSYDLIDRINCYFKLGASAGVRIEKDEMCWIEEIDKCVTWEQVVDIANRLFEQEKQKIEEQQEQMQEEQMQQGEGTADDSDDVQQVPQEQEDSDSDEDDDGEQGETDQTDEESQDDPEEEEEGELEDPMSKTEEALHENIRKEFNGDETKRVYNLRLNMNDPSPLIIGYKEVMTFPTDERIFTYGANLLKQFQVDNKKTINYMVKEFEMKKKASEYARTSLAKTGVICPVKMNNYKFSDDIFRKMAVTPEGKNHGMVMYVDWSGSMHKHVKPTIDQMLNLVMFCRQVNIPYRVYLFSDRFDGDTAGLVNGVNQNDLTYKNGFRLLEVFNNKMNRSDFTTMASIMLAVGQNYSSYVNYHLPWQFYLGGTPLDDAIMASIHIHNEFKKSNRLDIVNTVFLTDGDSHPLEANLKSNLEYRGIQSTSLWYTNRESIMKFIDPVTKKQYRVQKKNFTKALLEMFRDHTGSNAIGYRIVTMNKHRLRSELRHVGNEKFEEIHKELKKDRFSTIPNQGYTEFFAIAGGKALEVANTTMEVASDASVAKIRSAFKKANGNRKSTRLLLTKFIELVA
jgi:hypothetical protein